MSVIILTRFASVKEISNWQRKAKIGSQAIRNLRQKVGLSGKRLIAWCTLPKIRKNFCPEVHELARSILCQPVQFGARIVRMLVAGEF